MEKIEKSHWSHADNFKGDDGEYIKSFVHHNYDIGFHTHSFYELNIIFNGHGEHLIENMKLNVSRGCVFVIPPHIRHSYRNFENLHVYHMLIHRDFLSNCFGEFLKTVGFSLLFEIEPYFRAQHSENMFLVLNEDQINGIIRDLELLDSCKNLPDENIYINAIAKKILILLCLEITRQCGMQEFRTRSKKDLLTIADSLNFIHQNYDERITIEMLAERQNMSRATYIRTFTRICGCSPHQYLLNYRRQKASQLLARGENSLTEVAQACGFYDASHLRKQLIKETE